MTPTDFAPPDGCPFCLQISIAGGDHRCHGCTQAEHRHNLQKFGIALHGFVANWSSEPCYDAGRLCKSGVISEGEFFELREMLTRLFQTAESITSIIGGAIATDIAHDAYASGHRFAIDSPPADEFKPTDDSGF